ncbi:MAG: erythromycin esterase family protein [Longimicrobiales bacterium]
MAVATDQAIERVRDAAVRLRGEPSDFEALLARIGDARIVLLGEATHGTHEFYRARARLTQRLIREKGFNIVAVEADWPDAYRVNRYVRLSGQDRDADRALGDFQRFPRWMWRNTDVVALIDWLREHNAALRADQRVGFYGLDLYSLYGSMAAVLEYLEQVDAEAARRARDRYACFEQFGQDVQAYGYAASLGVTPSCEDEAVAQLLELQRRAAELASRDGRIPEDEYFFAEQNARVVRDAEEYYRMMFRGRVSSWNLRDRHMADTLDALLQHFDRPARPSRAIVWAHNSHNGDARATEMGAMGEWNLGQLARERHQAAVVVVGFTTYDGTVTAASSWDGHAELKRVRPALEDSYEALLHAAELGSFYLDLGHGALAATLAPRRLERAIGVVYMPQTERASHYFYAILPSQFDTLIHIDRTRALRPLEPGSVWEAAGPEPPETYPTGL